MKLSRVPVVLLALGLAGAAAPALAAPPAAGLPGAGPPPKASSFAPRHTGRRVFGSPIGPTILHARKRNAHRAPRPARASPSRAAAPAQP